MKLSRSFSARLSTTILVITSMLFIVSMLVVLLFSRKIIAEEAKKNAAEMLSSTSLNIVHTLDEAESTVKNVAWLVEERLEDTTYMYSITSAVVAINEEIVGSCIAFRPNYFEGKHYFAPYAYDSENDSLQTKQLGNDQYNYFKMEWFAVPFLTKKPHWSNPYFDKDGGQIMMTTYSYPIMNDKKEVIAVITADISIEWLTHQLCALNLNDNSKILLIGDKGQYISGNLPGIGFQEDIVKYEEAKKNPDFVKLIKKMTSLEKGTMTMRTGHYYSFAVYGPLYNGWSTAIITPTKNTFAKLNFMQFVIAIVSVIGLLLLFLSCRRIIKTLTRPVTEFSKAALVMAQGNFQAQLPQIETEDEIKDLHDSFEQMQQSITHYIQELKTTTATKERFESELNIARQIQLSMVPTDFPDNERFSVHALLQPAREVGGDFYDFQEKDDNLFFVIGDVSGKGVPAALVMAITRAAFHYHHFLESPQRRHHPHHFHGGKLHLRSHPWIVCVQHLHQAHYPANLGYPVHRSSGALHLLYAVQKLPTALQRLQIRLRATDSERSFSILLSAGHQQKRTCKTIIAHDSDSAFHPCISSHLAVCGNRHPDGCFFAYRQEKDGVQSDQRRTLFSAGIGTGRTDDRVGCDALYHCHCGRISEGLASALSCTETENCNVR